MINPGANWVPITDPVELLAFLKELKLTPKTFTEPKPLLYDGIYTKKPVPCKVVGYLDKSFIVIEVHGELHTIHIEHLKDMQAGSTAKLPANDILETENSDIPENASRGKITNYVCFDIETTGLNVKNDEIIEIAAIRIENGKVTAIFEQLIQPENPILFDIADLTGITNDMVADAPTIQEVMPDFLSFIQNSLLVGHNIAKFDLPFCQRVALETCGSDITNRYIDTMALAHKALRLNSYKLVQVAEALGIIPDRAHRALADCETTQRCFEALQAMAPDAISVQIFYPFQAQKPDLPDREERTSRVTLRDIKRFESRPHARDIIPATNIFDPAHPLYEQTCVITGEFIEMSAADVMQSIADCGGHCADNVTQRTTMLIVGGASNPDQKSGKSKRAEEYISKGQPIRIISEREFIAILNEPSKKSTKLPSATNRLTVSREQLAKNLEEYIKKQLDNAPEPYDINKVIAELRTPEKGKPYWALLILGQPCFRFVGGAIGYVEVAPIIMELVKQAGLALVPRASKNTWQRIGENDFAQWLEQLSENTVFIDIYEKLLQTNGFDCCSRYMACSEAGHCIHPDIMFVREQKFCRNPEDFCHGATVTATYNT